MEGKRFIGRAFGISSESMTAGSIEMQRNAAAAAETDEGCWEGGQRYADWLMLFSGRR